MRFPVLNICALMIGLSLAAPALSDEGAGLVDFQQHIQPVLEAKCLKCHGPKEDKGGLRVDDLEALRGYIEPGDLEASSLWTDYLRTEDPEMIMPPADETHPGGLPTGELLLLKEWILEGAVGEWLTAQSDTSATTEASAPAALAPRSTAAKVWAFQGIFHPAAVHLPVALLAVSALFVFLSFFNRESYEPVAFHCLWIGALGAVAACLTGWAYAVHEGYGAGFTFNLEKSDIDRHRWLGVFVAVFSLAMIPLARKVRKSAEINQRIIWLFAGLILMGAVSVVGFQGGELAYGENHYVDYYNELFKPETPAPATGEVLATPNADAPIATDALEPGQTDSASAADKPDASSASAPPTEQSEPAAVEPAEPTESSAATTEDQPAVPQPAAPATNEPATEAPTAGPAAGDHAVAEPSNPQPSAEN